MACRYRADIAVCGPTLPGDIKPRYGQQACSRRHMPPDTRIRNQPECLTCVTAGPGPGMVDGSCIMPVRRIAAACTAVAFAVGLCVAVTLTVGPPRPPVPVQQSGTAAGQPHRVSAAVSLGRVVDGRVVSASGGKSHLSGPRAQGSVSRVPGTVRRETRPVPLRLPKAGTTAETLRTAPAHVPEVGAMTRRPLSRGNPVR